MPKKLDSYPLKTKKALFCRHNIRPREISNYPRHRQSMGDKWRRDLDFIESWFVNYGGIVPCARADPIGTVTKNGRLSHGCLRF